MASVVRVVCQLFVIVFMFSVATAITVDYDISNSTDRNITFTCENEGLHNSLDLKNVTGKWKASEVYTHLGNEGVVVYQRCPMITIWELDEFPTSTFGPSSENPLFHVQHIKAKFRQEYRHLRLLWDEAGETTEYSLYFRNDSAGYWQVLDAQNGTLASRSNYQQFSGTIQVLKAVNDHVVLNFCQEPANNRPAQLYSVLFSREPGRMARWEKESVHNMLQNKKLSTASRRLVCGNGGSRPVTGIVFAILSCVLACLVSVAS